MECSVVVIDGVFIVTEFVMDASVVAKVFVAVESRVAVTASVIHKVSGSGT